MAANRIAGVCYVKAGAAQLALGGTVTVSPASKEREGKAGLSGVVGYVERPRVPYIELEGQTVPGFSAADLEAVEDETITAELANGSTYILRNAWLAAPLEINAAEGTYTARFEGMACDEV